MAQYARDGKSHAREVSVRIADEHCAGIPVEQQQRGGRGIERPHQEHAQQVRLIARAVDCRVEPRQVRQVEHEHRCRHHEALACLEAVDARVDVDAVRAEDGQRCYVHQIQRPQLKQLRQRSARLRAAQAHPAHGRARRGPQHVGDDDRGVSLVRAQQRHRADERQRELVPPGDVQHVVHEAQQQHEAHAQQRGVVLDLPRGVPHAIEALGQRLLQRDRRGEPHHAAHQPERFGHGNGAAGRTALVYVLAAVALALHVLHTHRDAAPGGVERERRRRRAHSERAARRRVAHRRGTRGDRRERQREQRRELRAAPARAAARAARGAARRHGAGSSERKSSAVALVAGRRALGMGGGGRRPEDALCRRAAGHEIGVRSVNSHDLP